LKARRRSRGSESLGFKGSESLKTRADAWAQYEESAALLR
jgi:hypothetical protein